MHPPHDMDAGSALDGPVFCAHGNQQLQKSDNMESLIRGVQHCCEWMSYSSCLDGINASLVLVLCTAFMYRICEGIVR
jgi:hypothetical protein